MNTHDSPSNMATNNVIPREFSKTKENIGDIQGTKDSAKAKKMAEKEDLTKEIELEEHVVDPLAGIKLVAEKMGFPPPNSIEEYMENGLSQKNAEVLTFI